MTKRLRYFTGQFLEAADFKAEQDYHVDMRRQGNRELYNAGILDDGFQVTSVQNASKIGISPGIGVDGQGRELVIVAPLEESPPPQEATPQIFFVTLKYDETPTDEQAPGDGDISDTTRYEERPLVRFFKSESDFDKNVAIVIARITIGTNGNISGPIDTSVRQHANARFSGKLSVGTTSLSNILHVNGATGIRQNRLYLNGDAGGSSLSYNAHRNEANNDWIFPDPSRPAVTLEMDDYSDKPRFEVWTTTSTNKTGWQQRFRIDGETGNVGIGTPDPKARLQVGGGAIMPAEGNSEDAGIMFPKDAFGGAGDAAWIRYYARSGENTTLEIGTSNDAGDHIALMPNNGNVGIGIADPQAKLHVNGNTLLAGNVKFSNANPASNIGFRNTLTPANIVKAWGLVKTGAGSVATLLDGFNIQSVSLDGSGFAQIILKEPLIDVVCMAGNAHEDGGFVSLWYSSGGIILARGYGVNPSSSSSPVAHLGWSTGEHYFSFIVIGRQ